VTRDETRRALRILLVGCAICSQDYRENVAIICDDDGLLTDEQETMVLSHLAHRHRDHKR
jgi:hypothetical protein